MKKILLLLAIFMVSTNSVYASDDKDSTMLETNQVKIQVKGVVCSFCAFGAKKNLSKLKFLNPMKLNKGVLFDVENQEITLTIAEDKKINLKKIYDSIKRGGYEPEIIYLRVKGIIAKEHIIHDQKKQLFFYSKSENLPDSGSVEVELHFDANIIPFMTADKPIEVSLDKIIE